MYITHGLAMFNNFADGTTQVRKKGNCADKGRWYEKRSTWESDKMC